ncbi:MAG: alpha/beta hydrolase [Clostridia bacterium]|nr:alpha/beta hydrolase [Clostridia bacterium]
MAVKGASGNLVVSINDFITSNIRDDKKRDEKFTTPDDIVRYDDILYGDTEVNVLDVYRPKNAAEKLPVIVSVHGGGWVYGNKGVNQFYCMSLSQKGFAVVNFSYRLAPEFKHPTPFIDTDKVFHWVMENAEKYGFDTENVFAVGDSVGANIVGLYSCACTDKAFAKKLSVEPPAGFLPRALGLNCGLYRMVRGKVDILMDNLADVSFPLGGTRDEFADIDMSAHVGAKFPPSFIATALGDFLKPQAKPFYDKLISLGVEAEYHCYGDENDKLKHVFHVDMNLNAADVCNSEECSFFLRHVYTKKG